VYVAKIPKHNRGVKEGAKEGCKRSSGGSDVQAFPAYTGNKGAWNYKNILIFNKHLQFTNSINIKEASDSNTFHIFLSTFFQNL